MYFDGAEPLITPPEELVKEFLRHAFTRLPGGSRGPLLRGMNLDVLRLLDPLGVAEAWVPAFAGTAMEILLIRTSIPIPSHALSWIAAEDGQ